MLLFLEFVILLLFQRRLNREQQALTRFLLIESFYWLRNVSNAHDGVTFANVLGIFFTIWEDPLSLVSFSRRPSELVPISVLDDLQVLVS